MSESESTAQRPEPPPGAEPPPPSSHAGPGVAVLLSLAAVAAAVIAGRASFMSSDASTNWQSAVRGQVKQSAAYVEDIRFVYTVEEPQALLAAEATFRVKELGQAVQASNGPNQTLLAVEQALQFDIAKAVIPATPLVSDPKYQAPAGYDVGRRLADVRNQSPALVALNPLVPEEAGDHFADRAISLIAATVLVGGAFLFGSLAQGFPRFRSAFLSVGALLLVAGIVGAVVSEAVA